jgi:hypothetical protein
VVEHLLSKLEALSSTFGTAKKQNKTKNPTIFKKRKSIFNLIKIVTIYF